MWWERKLVSIVISGSLCLSFILLYKVDFFNRNHTPNSGSAEVQHRNCEGSKDCILKAEDQLFKVWDDRIAGINERRNFQEEQQGIVGVKEELNFLPSDFKEVKNEELKQKLQKATQERKKDETVFKAKDLPKELKNADEIVAAKNVEKIMADIALEKKVKQQEKWKSDVETMIEENPEFRPLMQAVVDEDGQFLNQDDDKLVKIIEEKYLIPPSGRAYTLNDPKKENSMGQAQKIMEILKKKKNGFFIECGGFDGETRSNSLTLEKDLGWRGILVEADLDNLVKIKHKNRNAWTVPACLSTQNNTMFVSFRAWGHIGRIVSEDFMKKVDIGLGPEGENPDRRVNATCLPLFSILKALAVDTVDYFSLDVEGNELQILKTLPFDKINIKTLSVEFNHAGETGSSMGQLKDFMHSKGYVVNSMVLHPQNLAHDFIFVQKSIQMEIDEEAKAKEMATQRKMEEMKRAETNQTKTKTLSHTF